MKKNAMKISIESTIPTDFVLVKSADNIHFHVTVVSPIFDNMKKIEQHKIIMDIFRDDIKNEDIHALSIKTMTPKNWQKLNT